MRTVTFGMYWQCHGRQTIDLPEEIDVNDVDAVTAFIKRSWSKVPVPNKGGDYIPYSDEFDEESPIDICENGFVINEF